jgi:hypothetical protein
MTQSSQPDVLSDLDAILQAVDTTTSPWYTDPSDGERKYDPDRDLLEALLRVPIADGYADDQQSGRVARSLDAWVAAELRRGGFPPHAVFPRAEQPRVLSTDLAEVGDYVQAALARLAEFEARMQTYVAGAAKKGYKARPPSFYRVRPAIRNIRDSLPSSASSSILGRFYVKEVDVVISDWRRGPDVLVSTKTQFSSYLNNKNNRYEEAIGEAHNLRDRYPMAAMGYAYLVRDNVFEERAFQLLRDLLVRLRKPDGPFDATMLIVASWDKNDQLTRIEDPAEALDLPRFFHDLLHAVMTNTPVDLHEEVRRRHLGEEPMGGFPPPEDAVPPDE